MTAQSKTAQGRRKAAATTSYRTEVALGNGMAPADLPKFRRHVHPETGEGTHTGWTDCALTSCTWAGSTEAHRPAAAKATPAAKLDAAIDGLADALAAGGMNPVLTGKPKGKGKLVLVEGVGTTLPAAPAAPRKNTDRRNEVTHDDGRAAVDAFGCKSCGAKKGYLCFAKSGEPTNHVHAARMSAFDAKVAK